VSDFEVVLAAEAETDITDALIWYCKRSALAADGFRVEVFDAIDQIGETPLSWPID
jgi:plasmid stabilization system protein ParE